MRLKLTIAATLILTFLAIAGTRISAQQQIGGVSYPSSAFASLTVANPLDSPCGGTTCNYVSTQTITIATTTPGAAICYTTDGTTPTATSPGTCSHGTTYSGSFSSASSGTETVEYLGTLVGWINSSVITATYIIGTPPGVNQAAKCVGAYGTSASTTCVFGSNVTSGNYALVFQVNSGITSYGTPTKSSGTATIGTPTQEGGCAVSGPVWPGCYWLIPITGTGSLTIGLSQTSSGGSYVSGGIYEINHSTGTVDATSTYKGGSCTSCSGNSLSTTGTNRIVITSIYQNGTLSSPSPFTFSVNANDSQGNAVGLGSYQKAASGSYSPTWTSSAGTAGDQSIAIY